MELPARLFVPSRMNLDRWPQFVTRRAVELDGSSRVISTLELVKEAMMGFGRGALLWLLGVPLPIVILLALFWH